MKHLTDRQRQILEFIEIYIDAEGRPPSHGDIAHAFSISRSAVGPHLMALESKKKIKVEPGKDRAIRLVSHETA